MDDVEFETKLLEMNWYVQKAFDLLSFDSTHLADECNDLLDEPGDLIPTVDDLLKEHFEELHQSFLLNKFDDPQFEWEIVRRTGGTGNDIFECPYRDEHIFGSSAHFLGLNYYIIVEDEIHSALISRGSSLATALIPEFEAFVDALFQPLDRIRAMMERERLLLISWQPRTDTPADSRKRFQKRS
ncbi:MAG: hypothetical protein KDA80_19305, partial [Planctomycetaceae bacterium]|nr:hypothetical protein [Planctomycetaceae bacterium]